MALAHHFAAKNNVVERRLCLTHAQSPGESVLECLGALRHLGSFCDSGVSLETRIPDVFLAGLTSSKIQDRVIGDPARAWQPILVRFVFLAHFEEAAGD